MRTGQRLVSTGEVLRSVLAALESVDHAGRVSASHGERLEWVRLATDARRRVEGLVTALVAEADGARSSTVVAGTPLSSWLAQDKRVSLKDATRDVLGAKDVAARERVKAAALEGEIGVEQAKAITRVLRDLPRDLDTAQKELAEELLLEMAATTPASSIPRLRGKVLDVIRPKTDDTREAEMRRLEEQRRRALARRYLTLEDDYDGSVLIRGSLPHLEAQPLIRLLEAYVESHRRQRRHDGTDMYTKISTRQADALTAIAATHLTGTTASPSGPRTAATTPADAIASPGGRGTNPTATAITGGGQNPAAPAPGASEDPATPTSGASQDPATPVPGAGRAGIAELTGSATPTSAAAGGPCGCGNSPPGRIRVPEVAGSRPRITVTIQEVHLRELADQAGLLPGGAQIPASELRRLLCDADLIPAVLGSASEVLDVGREQRVVTPAIRRALSIRDGGCIFPSCDVPDARCEAHHIRPWWNNGSTSLSNLALLCPHHHGVVEPDRFSTRTHPDRWQIKMGENGKPELIPPRGLEKSGPGNASARPRAPGRPKPGSEPDEPRDLDGVAVSGRSGTPRTPNSPAPPPINTPLWEDEPNPDMAEGLRWTKGAPTPDESPTVGRTANQPPPGEPPPRRRPTFDNPGPPPPWASIA